MKTSVRNILNRIGKSQNRKAEIIRFLLTGGFATVLQYGFYLMFLNLCGLSAVISTVISYGLSFVANYFISNIFTFKTRPSSRNALYFTLSHLVNLGLQTLLVAIFSKLMPADYALVPAMAICVPCNYLMVRYALKQKIN